HSVIAERLRSGFQSLSKANDRCGYNPRREEQPKTDEWLPDLSLPLPYQEGKYHGNDRARSERPPQPDSKIRHARFFPLCDRADAEKKHRGRHHGDEHGIEIRWSDGELS